MLKMLTSLHLNNFKAFTSRTIRLGRLTLLSGLNGTGKSSILQSLAMLRQSSDSGFLNDGAWLLNGELVELGRGADVLCEHGTDSIAIGVTEAKKRAEPLAEETWSVEYNATSNVLRPQANQPLMHPSRELNLFQPGFQYLRADRVNPAVTFPKSHYAVHGRRFLGSRGEYTSHFLLDHRDEDIPCEGLIHPDEPEARGLLSQVNSWIQVFSPGVRVSVQDVPMTDLVRLEFQYRSQGFGYGNPFRATNVGYGLTYSLPIVVAALASQPGSLVLIENPEAHLHPLGQLAIGDLLARAAAARVQIIIETHSDHVLNGIRLAVKRERLPASDAVLHFFERNAAGDVEIQSPTVDQHGLLSEWPPGFFTQWDDTLLELLS